MHQPVAPPPTAEELARTLWDVVIIGAGIAGLAARQRLQAQGLRVLTLEKSRGLGGRASTRRAQGFFFDLGLQYFQLSRPEATKPSSSQSTPTPTDPPWNDLSQASLPVKLLTMQQATSQTVIHPQGMSKLSELFLIQPPLTPSSLLAQDRCPILRQVRATELRYREAQWQVHTDTLAFPLSASSLLLSAPVPQALELLGPKQTGLLLPTQAAYLKQYRYEPCISLALHSEHRLLALPGPFAASGVALNPAPEILALFDQRQKGLAQEASLVVIHLTPAFSRMLWEESDESILQAVRVKLQPLLPALSPPLLPFYLHAGQSPQGIALQEGVGAWIQKWRYAQPGPDNKAFQDYCVLHFQASQRIPPHQPLVLIGDSFPTPLVPQAQPAERAFHSGRSAAEYLLELRSP